MNAFSDINIDRPNVTIHVRLSEFNGRFDDAQMWLDNAVMNSMLPFMPKRTGSMVQRTRARSTAMMGTGEVCAAVPPYGRFQYGGLVMIDPVTGSPWARKNAVKALTDRPLHYSQPGAMPKWFEPAKARDLQMWIDGVEERLTE